MSFMRIFGSPDKPLNIKSSDDASIYEASKR